jgi:hypothetical protein
MDILQEQQKAGMFKSITVQALHVKHELTEVEKAAIDKAGIGDRVIVTWPLRPTVSEKNISIMGFSEFSLTVEKLKRGETIMKFNSQLEAQEMMQELEKKLPLVKQMLQTAEAPTSKTLEF